MEAWLSRLRAGDDQAAWDLFSERYRPLIIASISSLLDDRDDVMDVFSTVCHALIKNDYARLKRYSDQSSNAASVSTWIVTVVHNLTVDWIRSRDGRRRYVTPSTLSSLHREIHEALCRDGLTVAEAFERVQGRTEVALVFHHFLREARESQRLAPCQDSSRTRFHATLVADASAPADSAEQLELSEQLNAALADHPPDLRLAIELFVVEELSAAEVANVVGWPNARAVYNRVGRALEKLRIDMERRGIGRQDL
ncbi:MAG: sigma-70 family RNA polymerase sigma factor [Longimicrobiales bacterium]